MRNDSAPNPAVIIGYQLLAMAAVVGSFFLLPTLGGLVGFLGAGTMLVPVGVFGVCLTLYWRRNRETLAGRWYAGAMTVGFAIGYLLSYGLAFLIGTGD